MDMMDTYCWSTSEPHSDNYETMSNFLDFHLKDTFSVVEQDGSYARIKDDEDGCEYHCYASGNGDFKNHRVDFENV